MKKKFKLIDLDCANCAAKMEEAIKKIDGVKTELYTESMTMKQMYSVCDVKAGDLVWLEFQIKEDEQATIDVQAGVLNSEVFWAGYEVLAASTLELTHFSNTKVKGTISCNRDGLLYTSIPDNGNWTVTVDGDPAEIKQVGECMIGVEVTKGEHTVVYRYRNQSFVIGLIVSFVSLLLFVAILFLGNVLRNNRGRYQTSSPRSSHKEIGCDEIKDCTAEDVSASVDILPEQAEQSETTEMEASETVQSDETTENDPTE